MGKTPSSKPSCTEVWGQSWAHSGLSPARWEKLPCASAMPASYLVREPRAEHVLAHGRVLVHEAGALLATLVLPQQAGPVDHPAEGDGSRDAACGQAGSAPGRDGAGTGGQRAWALGKATLPSALPGVEGAYVALSVDLAQGWQCPISKQGTVFTRRQPSGQMKGKGPL